MGVYNWLSCLGSCAALWLAVLPSDGSAASHLSSAQVAVVAWQIAKLKYPQERSVASRWSDAKKAAEFICRPLAMRVLKRGFKGADRVFLGTDDPSTLHLLGNRRLTGSGQVRIGYDWQTFTFSCKLDPRTGEAVSFETTLASAARRSRMSLRTSMGLRSFFRPGTPAPAHKAPPNRAGSPPA
jgi:hypothetical protein